MVSRRKPASGGNCKMSASLAALVESREWGAALGEPMVLAARGPSSSAALSYHVFVRCTDPDAQSIAGVARVKGGGEVRTVIVTAAKLAQFVADDRVRRVSAPRRLRPLMDLAPC